jgi:2-polyprenyl-3-methyl-5-hydroxy-6-metoxy-1,4-benzoquinol methylase
MTDGGLYDEVAARYHEWISQDGVTLEDPTFADLVGDVSGQGVFAVACGAGREARFLAPRGAVVTGVDLTEGLLSIAWAEEAADPLRITYICRNAHDLSDLNDASF